MPDTAPAAPAAAPAAPAAPAESAIASTPVTPSPQASPAGPRRKQTPNATNTTRVTYGSGHVRAERPAPTPVVREAAPAPAAETPAPEMPVAAEAPAELELAGTETAPATTEAPAEKAPEAPAAEETPSLDKKEFAKRMATIARAESKLASEKQKFSEEQAKHREALSKVEQMNKAGEIARRDPLGFMQRMFGVTPQHVVDHLSAVQKGQKPPEIPAPAPNPTDEKISALQKQLDEALAETKNQKVQRDVADYVSTQVAPLVTDKAKFPFLNHKLGAKAAEHVYLTMEANWKRDPSKPPPSPQRVAEFIEKHFRDEASKDAQLLSGGSAAPAQAPANPKKVVAPPATAKPATAQQPPAANFRRPRLTGKSYTSALR